MERSKGRKGEDCRASWEEEVGELLLAVDDGGSLLLLFYGEEGRRGAGAAWLLLLSMENKKDAGTTGEGRSSACTCAHPGETGRAQGGSSPWRSRASRPGWRAPAPRELGHLQQWQGASMAAGRAKVSAMGTAGSHEAERGRWEVEPWSCARAGAGPRKGRRRHGWTGREPSLLPWSKEEEREWWLHFLRGGSAKMPPLARRWLLFIERH
jgi:hypothetical protein